MSDAGSPRIFGLEGTAWAASAAVFEGDPAGMTMETEPFQPPEGGIDPNEAAEHMMASLPGVIEDVLAEVDETQLDAVAFSRGPGLGPCLRLTAAAARTLAGRLGVPLIGVNHMVAHAEVGRILGDLEDPIVLNASGANAHVLAFKGGRYRVLGETMDTGVGNALDKFSRHLGWSHPGGPQVERHARTGTYVELPYVVKGMDLSFSGIVSAAKELIDAGKPVENVCCGLQETIFAMLTEVSERALALTYRDELVLGGGVSQNERLREMLGEMVTARDATLYVPPPRFRGDNAGMIAITASRMLDAGETIDIADSTVRPDQRPDEVPVPWRSDGPDRSGSVDAIEQGAEATLERRSDGTIVKRRNPKSYRHPDLDDRLRRARTTKEARLLHAARREGVPTPQVVDIDPHSYTLILTEVGRWDLRDRLDASAVRTVGSHLGRLHAAGMVHGDPTIRNVRVGDGPVHLLDFGLGYHSDDVEDWAMDLHVFLQSIRDIAPEGYREPLLDGYRQTGSEAVIDRLDEIEGRGRYR